MKKPILRPLGSEASREPNLLLGLASFLLTLVAIFPLQRASASPPPLLYRQVASEPQGLVEPYARLALELPQIEEYLRLFQGIAQLPEGDAVLNLQEVIDLRPESPAAFLAHLALARHFASQDDPRADDQYQATLELEDSPALHLEWAGYLEAQGRREEAYQEYKALLDSAEFPEAFIGLRRLASDDLQLAQDLITATYFGDALEVLREHEEEEAVPLLAQAHFGVGAYEEALPLYEAWVGAEPENETARIGLARTLGRLGRLEEALEQYQQVDSADSLLAQGEILELLGETEEALEVYGELFAQGLYPVAWWRAAGILESEDRLEEALPFYEAVAESGTNLADDAAYRLYILAGRLGDADTQSMAQSLLQGMKPNHLAFLATGEELPPQVAPSPPPAGEAIIEKAVALRYLGLFDLARRELLYAARFSESPAVDLAMAQALSESGAILDAQAMVEVALRDETLDPVEMWRLAYPKPYAEEVQAAAQEFNLDPLLIYAMIHAESRYDPEAVSRSYAQGLMQIIPSTRDWIAEQLGLVLTPVDIFDPAINIRFGAYYLRFVLDFFDQDIDYALAAYNGGPGNVGTWLEDPLVGDKDDFIRWMGLAEPREYLEAVLLNYRIYQWLETQ
ncbi:MAG: transglycosylase SLT domain-containing protein [Chloroflexi bacterium]|nr:transglycosylase SLT domain-containing protein [Chloroflexota bacterium]